MKPWWSSSSTLNTTSSCSFCDTSLNLALCSSPPLRSPLSNPQLQLQKSNPFPPYTPPRSSYTRRTCDTSNVELPHTLKPIAPYFQLALHYLSPDRIPHLNPLTILLKPNIPTHYSNPLTSQKSLQ